MFWEGFLGTVFACETPRGLGAAARVRGSGADSWPSRIRTEQDESPGLGCCPLSASLCGLGTPEGLGGSQDSQPSCRGPTLFLWRMWEARRGPCPAGRGLGLQELNPGHALCFLRGCRREGAAGGVPETVLNKAQEPPNQEVQLQCQERPSSSRPSASLSTTPQVLMGPDLGSRGTGSGNVT